MISGTILHVITSCYKEVLRKLQGLQEKWQDFVGFLKRLVGNLCKTFQIFFVSLFNILRENVNILLSKKYI